MNGPASDGRSVVIELLQREDYEINRLFNAFFSTECAGDDVRRGIIGKELVDRLSMHDAGNEQIAGILVQDMGRIDLAEELDRHSRRYRGLVSEVDDISAGVSPRDICPSDSRRFDGLIIELRDLRHEQVGFEVERVIPAIRHSLSPQRQQRLADQIERARRQATTRHAQAPSDRPELGLQRSSSRFVSRMRAAVDGLRGARRAPAGHGARSGGAGARSESGDRRGP